MKLTALSGYPEIIVCCQKPVAPVSWTFRHLPDSEAQHVVTAGSIVSDYTDRFGILDSSLIIYNVQPSDVGSYDCCDAKRDVFTYKVTVVGKEIAFIVNNEIDLQLLYLVKAGTFHSYWRSDMLVLWSPHSATEPILIWAQCMRVARPPLLLHLSCARSPLAWSHVDCSCHISIPFRTFRC